MFRIFSVIVFLSHIAFLLSAFADSDTLVILPLDEGTGFLAGDISGNSNDGILRNGATFEADAGDGSAFAVRLDGVDDFIDLGGIDVNGTGLTLAARFKANSFPGPSNDPRLISKATGVSGNDHLFMLGTVRVGTEIRLRARVRIDGSTTTLIASSGALATGVWQHAAMTYDGTTLRLYLDAEEVGSKPLSGTVDIDPLVSVAVGAQPAGAGPRYFDGLMDDVRILQRALDVSELAAIVHGGDTNQVPVAGDDSYSVTEDNILIVSTANGVLNNDSDPDLDILQAVIVSNPSNGDLTLNADGAFVYTSTANFYGTDSFTYRANDGLANSNIGTVTLTVTPVSDPPVAQDDTFQTLPDTALNVIVGNGVLANDSDPDTDPLTAILSSGPLNGALMLAPDGSFVYTPEVGFKGEDSFTYNANDGSTNSNLATVTISVDNIPIVNSPPQIISGSIAFNKQIIGTAVDETHFAGAAELTGDNHIDAIATDYVNGKLLLYVNDGSGGFLPSELDSNLAGAYPAHLGDVDGDGDTDVLAGGYLADVFAWYENKGDGLFIPHVIDGAADGPHSIITVDMDYDGDVDLVTSSQDANNIAWYENDGANNFSRHLIDSAAYGAKRAEVADLDGDGDLDVLAASFFNDEVVWHENDGSLFFTKHVIDSTVNGAYYVTPADVDGDGDIDIFAASQLDNTIAWYQNDGSAGFATNTMDSSARGARSIIAADMDRDGNVDALTASVDDDMIAWFRNEGSGDFTKYAIDASALGAYGVFAIDMDHDGDLDVLSASRDADTIALHTQIQKHVASVDTGGILAFGQALLETVDSDDSPSELIYTITSTPQSGSLLLDGVPLSTGGTFTQADINNGHLSYIHGGTRNSTDKFTFTVSDGGENGFQPIKGEFSINIGFSGPIAILPLDEGSGTIVNDTGGLDNYGTLINGASFDPETGDGSPFSVHFDGVDDLIDLGNIDATGTGLTLAVWFNADSFPGPSNDPRIISKAKGVASNDHIFMLGTIRVGSDIRLRGRVRIQGQTITLIANSGNLLPGVWQHASMTYDGYMLRLYLNGLEVGSALLSGTIDVDGTMEVAAGGQPPGAGSRFFDGRIDDIRIIARALIVPEINQIITGGN